MLHIDARLLDVARFAEALGVVPVVTTTQSFGLDVIDFNGWCDQAPRRTMPAERLGIEASITKLAPLPVISAGQVDVVELPNRYGIEAGRSFRHKVFTNTA